MKKIKLPVAAAVRKTAISCLMIMLFALISNVSWGQTTNRFNDGYLTVFKVTNGSALVNTGTQIVTEEYLPIGASQSSPNYNALLPTGASGVVVSGTASSAGAISRSENGRFLLIPGYAAAIGDANSTFTSNGTARTLNGSGALGTGIVGTIYSTANDLRGATSDDGTNYWFSGGSVGVKYTNNGTTVTTISTTSTNTRVVHIFNGQLFYATGSATNGIYQVGTGKPTSLVTSVLQAPASAPYSFSVSPDGLTIYAFSSANQIVRFTYSGTYNSGTFTYSGGSWSSASTGFTLTGATGLAVDWNGYSFSTGANGAKIFACNPTTLVTGNDNGTGAITTTTLRAISGNNAFRGLAFSPIKQTVSKGTNTPAAGSINTSTNDVVLFQFNLNADEGNSTLKKVIVKQNGTATIGTGNDIANFRLIDDADNDGVFDVGETVLSTGTVGGTDITFSSISLSSYINEGSGKNLLVVGNIGATGGGNTFIPTIVSNKSLNGVNYTTNLVNAGGSWVTIGAAAPTGNTLTIQSGGNPNVNLSVSSNTASETSPTAITVTATASSAVSGDQTVSLAVTGVAAGDYTLTNTTITIPDGLTTGTVTFTVVDDPDIEGTEIATLTISSPSSGISLGSTISQNITITDNDAPSVNLSVSTNSASETSPTAITVTATASSAVTGPQTVTVAVTGTGITAGDYTLPITTITIPDGLTTGTVNFTVVDDAVIEGAETATLTISSPSSGIILGATISQNITITDNDITITKIHSIQGSGSTFALGGTRTIEGIVTRTFPGATKLSGFYIQEEDADADANPLTSEGIFVFDAGGLFTGNPGDRVQVTGTISEFTSTSANIVGNGSSSLTEITATSVVNLGASSIPAITNVVLPVADFTDLERYEGMLVNLSSSSGPLTVTETFKLGRYGQVGLSGNARLDNYTQLNAPSVSGYANYLANLQDNYIILDDGSSTQNPDPEIFARGGLPLSASNTLRGGDNIASISGIMDHRFEGYRIQTTTAVNFLPANPRPAVPSVGGTVKTAFFNVLNYFVDLDNGGNVTIPNGLTFQPRGANTATEFTRQRDKIVSAITAMNADVIGVSEIENDGNASLQNLVNGLNAVAGPGTYAFVNDQALVNDPNAAINAVGTDAIKVGIIYKPGVLTPVGSPITYLEPNPSNPIFSRPPVAQTFMNSNGVKFTIIVNHFKSKGSSAGLPGDADLGDGQALSNATRVAQANALLSFITTVQTASGDNKVLVLGDLNAYALENPITTLTGGGLTNLFPNTSYSYQFNGQWGSLDHALATSSLNSLVSGAAKWHINSDEPVVLDYNTEFKSAGQVTGFYSSDGFRSSDHDALIVGLNLPLNTVTLSVSASIASEAAATVVTVTATASSAVTGDQTVSLAVTSGGGTTITGGDYSLSNTTITILNGQTTGSVTFTITDDAVAEGPEIATLTISSPSAGIILGTTTSRNVNIADNDVPLMRITEYMYNGSEFAEFTNVGNTAIDMTGWSFDDASRTAGSQPLGAFGVVQPGESVIFSEASESSFRSTWGLCSGIKIIGGNTNNLGASDEINLYNATGVLVDRITYSTTTGPQANNSSAWVSASGLGANLHSEWTLSTVADAEASVAVGATPFVGSPGKSTRATVAYNPCPVVNGAPTIVIDVTATSNFLDGGAAISPASPYGISAVSSDPTDPAKFLGVDFTVGDDVTPLANLVVTVATSNAGVAPLANLILTGNGASRNLKITPLGVGYANITVSVFDGTNTTNYILNYAASAASVNTSTTRFHTGTSDASTAQMLDANYMLVGDDENQVLRLYDRQNSGLPLTGFNFSASLGLAVSNPEVDIEASVKDGNRIYWLGSHSNSKDGDPRPNRYRLFATDITGTGAATTLSYFGRYDGLRTDLINWDVNNTHGLGANFFGFAASAAPGVIPETANGSGFNIEGLTLAPNGTTAYISFRAPISPANNRTKGLIVQVTNFASLINGAGPATFGTPIQLDLGGRGIREIKRNASGQYLIIAGSHDATNNFRLYTWTGNAADAPVLRTADLTALNANGSLESIVDVPDPLLSTSTIQLLVDNGDAVYYEDNIIAKDLSNGNHKKFRSELVVLGTPPVVPTVFYVNDNSLTGDHYTTAVGNDANPGTAALPFRTIQHAIDVAATGNTIYVDAGTYIEQITVSKSLTILGSNETLAGCSGGRVAESIIMPSTSQPFYDGSTEVRLMQIEASNVTVKGFTFDGNNPALTARVIDAADGIDVYVDVDGIIVENNIFKNLNEGGVTGYPSGTASMINNSVSNNKFDNLPGDSDVDFPGSGYGVAVLVYNNFYATVDNNCMTNVRIGVQTGNYNLANTGGTAPTINNNQVGSKSVGVFHNLHYQDASPFTISNNQFTAADAANTGMVLWSMQGTSSAVITSNTITGGVIGIEAWNNPTTNTITVSGGSITNARVGLLNTNYSTYGDANSGSLNITGITFTNCDTAIWVRDSNLNTNSATVALNINNATNVINGSGLGVLVEGADASVAFNGAAPANFSTSLSKYIRLITNGTNVPSAGINAQNVQFGGANGTTLSNAALFAVEDKIDHKIDWNSLGFVSVKANHDFVTANSFYTPNTTTASIQRGVNAASNGFTVNVDAGTFDGQVVIDNKNITLKGAGATTIIRPSSPTVITSLYTYPAGVFPGWIGTVMASTVLVKNTTAVTLKDFKVDGVNVTSLPAGSARLAGVLLGESGGVIDNVTVSTIKTTGYTDRSYGIDISAVSASRTVEVKNCNISDWGRNGIQAMGGSLTANIHNNTLVGPGTIGPNNVPNGILFIHGVGGNAISNVIHELHYSDPDFASAGILLYNPLTAGIVVEENEVYNSDNGITFAANANDAIVRKNYIHNNEVGVQFENGALNNAVTNNTITNNSITAIQLEGATDPGGPGTPPGTGNYANFNDLGGNPKTVINYDNTQTFNATCNWHGSAVAATVAAKITGMVNYIPYLADGTDIAPATMGFQTNETCAACNEAAPTATPTQPTCAVPTGTITVNTPVPATGITYTVTGPSPATTAVTNATGVFPGLAAGSYSVTITNASGCTSPALTITLNAVTLITPTFTQVGPLCTQAALPRILTRAHDNSPGGSGILMGAPWNNLTGPVTTGLVDELGNTTTVGLNFNTTFWHPFTGGPPITGNNSGVYPDNVLREFFYFGYSEYFPNEPPSPETINVGVTGLDPLKKYKLTFFASSDFVDNNITIENNGSTKYTVGATSVSLAVFDNRTDTVFLGGLSPDAQGTITFTMSKDGPNTAIGFLNALIITPEAVSLPTSSTNNPPITGAWSPAFNASTPGTTLYTFTPNPGQCATTATMNVTVYEVPTLPVIGPITQPTCAVPTGTVTVTSPANGTGITYTITGPSPATTFVTNATGIFTGLVPGDYTITTSNPGGCTSPALSVTINTVPGAPVTPTATATQPTCAIPTGTITVNTPVPAANVSYTVTGPSPATTTVTNTNGIFAGLAPGNYAVTTTNTTTGCTSAPVSVTINAVPGAPVTPTATATQPTCAIPTGTITVNTPVPAANVSYTVTGPSPATTTVTNTNGIFAGLAPGNYAVTTTNTTTGCTSAPVSVTINTVPGAPVTPTATATQPTCAIPTGTITVNTPVPAANVSYTVTGPSPATTTVTNTNGIFAGLAPGNYAVTTTNTTTGCTSAPVSVTINTVPGAPVTPTATATQPSCAIPTGTITINTPVPAANVSYTVTGPSPATTTVTNTNGIFAGLAPGNYAVTTTNTTTGCTSVPLSVTINAVPALPVITAPAVTHPTCGVTTGTIVVNATGSGALEYSIDNGTNWQPSATFSGLVPATYIIKVRLASSITCVSTYSGNPVAINAVPVAPTVNPPSLTQPTCTIPTGTIVVNATGSGTLDYSIDNGTNWQPSATFSGLAPASYIIKVRLANSTTCITAYSGNPVDIIAATGCCTPPVIAVPVLTQPTCAVPAGTIVVNATGSGTLEYSVNGGTNWGVNNTFSGLTPGNYNIQVRLLSSPTCLAIYNNNPVVINAVPAIPSITAPTVTQPTCTVPTGTIVVNATGNGTLEYSINGGTNWDVNNIFSGLTTGNYNIQVRLQSSATCIATYTSNPVILVPASVPVVTAPTVTQPTCAVVTGAIVVNATGSGTLEYSVDNGANWQTPNTFSLLAAGSYNIKVRLLSSPTCSTAYSGNPVVLTTALCNGKAIPGKIEAEVWDAKNGVQYNVPTSDAGGGQQVIGMANGSWLDYDVTVTQTGTYNVEFRVATLQNNVALQVKLGATVLGTVNIMSTGGWDNWQTILLNNISLTAGVKTIRIQQISNESCNFNWMNWVLATAATAPTANAGSPQTIILPTSQVNLSGSGTANNGGSITGYAWTLQSKPVGAPDPVIQSPATAATLVTGLVQGIYTFRLTVTQNDLQTAFSDVTITVTTPLPPTANAGPPQTITLPLSQVNLSGSGTANNGASITGYAWTLQSKPVGATDPVIQSPLTPATLVTGFVQQGVYTFRLTVTRNDFQTAFSDVAITVNPSGTPGKFIPGKVEAESFDGQSGGMYGVTTNDAGGGQHVVGISNGSWMDYNVTVTQTGIYTVNFRAATTRSNVQFQIKLGAAVLGTVNISNTGDWNTWATSSVTNISLTAGVQTIRIQSNELCNLNWTDWLLATPSTAPTANAGSPQTITLPTNVATLTGSGTAGNGTPIYGWSQVGGTAATIDNPTSSTTTISGLTTAGVRTFRLTVTQTGDAQSATSDVTVTVNATSPPTANAGPPQTITLPTSQVNLSGSGTANNGGLITGYAWTLQSKPVGATDPVIQSPLTAATLVTGFVQPGIYTFRLTVTRNDFQTAFSDVAITVNPSGTPGKFIPGKVEAESFDGQSGGMYGVTTNDAGGGQHVVGISNGSWMDYNVTVTQTGIYTVNFRAATTRSNVQFQIKLGAAVLGTVNISNTGDWNTWATSSVTNISLTAGVQTIRIQSNELCNFNWTDWVLNAPPVAPLTIAAPKQPEEKEITANKLSVSVFPNPAESFFNLKVQSKIQDLVTIKVFDMAGRQVQQLQGVPGQALRFGDHIVNGTYLVEVRQGAERVVTKVIKQ